ncbi:MAG TPA: hypothetical protein VFY76_04590 [Nocardioides sp.]|nr:hypothetical protein [Nocardioides sp.]
MTDPERARSREEDLGHGDIEAALAARRELGARYDAELVDGFAERIERTVERRVAERGELQQRRTAGLEGARIRQFVLGVISVGVGVPITIVPTVAVDGAAGLPAVVVAWLGIVGVNAAHAAAINGGRRRD